jgi:hypothetical protein
MMNAVMPIAAALLIVMLSVNMLTADCRIFIAMPNFVMTIAVMLNFVMLRIIMLNVIMLNAVMLSVVFLLLC